MYGSQAWVDWHLSIIFKCLSFCSFLAFWLISLVNEIQFILITSGHISSRSIVSTNTIISLILWFFNARDMSSGFFLLTWQPENTDERKSGWCIPLKIPAETRRSTGIKKLKKQPCDRGTKLCSANLRNLLVVGSRSWYTDYMYNPGQKCWDD